MRIRQMMKLKNLVLQAKVYEKLGDYKSAIKILSEFMKVFAEDPDWNPHEDPDWDLDEDPLSDYEGEDFYLELLRNIDN